ncbi:hypothetical protein Y032_0004g1706 [Ancylostoma ceylanicum]|nr:hypothetical protein Y032_0004g1706 [Ancylostoma ceylanicum]
MGSHEPHALSIALVGAGTVQSTRQPGVLATVMSACLQLSHHCLFWFNICDVLSTCFITSSSASSPEFEMMLRLKVHRVSLHTEKHRISCYLHQAFENDNLLKRRQESVQVTTCMAQEY